MRIGAYRKQGSYPDTICRRSSLKRRLVQLLARNPCYRLCSEYALAKQIHRTLHSRSNQAPNETLGLLRQVRLTLLPSERRKAQTPPFAALDRLQKTSTATHEALWVAPFLRPIARDPAMAVHPLPPFVRNKRQDCAVLPDNKGKQLGTYPRAYPRRS